MDDNPTRTPEEETPDLPDADPGADALIDMWNVSEKYGVTCVKVDRTSTRVEPVTGKTFMVVWLIADTAPADFPVTGAGVNRIADNIQFDVGSVLQVLDEKKQYILGHGDEVTPGAWYEA